MRMSQGSGKNLISLANFSAVTGGYGFKTIIAEGLPIVLPLRAIRTIVDLASNYILLAGVACYLFVEVTAGLEYRDVVCVN